MQAYEVEGRRREKIRGKWGGKEVCVGAPCSQNAFACPEASLSWVAFQGCVVGMQKGYKPPPPPRRELAQQVARTRSDCVCPSHGFI